MKDFKCRLINSLYMLSTVPGHRNYKNNIKNFREIQLNKILSIIKNNHDTSFGKEHQFARIHDVESFQKKVPIREYEDLEPYIERIAWGEPNVLTSERVILFEPTGGTTSGSKLIPYTRSLKKEFQKAIIPWLYSIYKNNPQLLRGKSYWSITPALSEKKYTHGGIPIGFEEDSDYLGVLGKILKQVLIAPREIDRIKDIENFRFITAYFLLLEKSLSLISVWNPTFLVLILETIEKHIERLIADIDCGTLTLPHPEPIDFMAPYLKPHPARAAEIRSVVGRSFHKKKLPGIWEQLVFISCWDSGFASYYKERLRDYFPNVNFQGKGLIATEGIVTIPYLDPHEYHEGYFPAYMSHFFEFLPVEEQNGKTQKAQKAKLLHQLEEGKEYYVIITTSGGLYRYNLKDRVRVTAKYSGLPLLQFLGRDNVSDIMGEKLSYGQVRQVIENALQQYHFKPGFIMLAPVLEDSHCYYSLFIETRPLPEDSLITSIGNHIERGLGTNFHYRYARDLGQIKPLKLFFIHSNGIETYFKRCIHDGQKAGDIKPSVLDKRTGWEEHFNGRFHTDPETGKHREFT